MGAARQIHVGAERPGAEARRVDARFEFPNGFKPAGASSAMFGKPAHSTLLPLIRFPATIASVSGQIPNRTTEAEPTRDESNVGHA